MIRRFPLASWACRSARPRPQPELPETVAVSAYRDPAVERIRARDQQPLVAPPGDPVNLRQRGPMSPDGLATHLGASRTGVLQQLHALEDAGLVAHQVEKHGVGRPRHRYDVTADAQDLFPADYDGLALSLVDAIAEVGGDALLDEVLAARRRQLGAASATGSTTASRRMPRSPIASGSWRSCRTRGGYLAEAIVSPDGTVRLREHNCAIFHVAQDVGRLLRGRAGPLRRGPRRRRGP